MAYFEEAEDTAELVVDAAELVVDAAELVVDAAELVVDAAELVVDAAELVLEVLEVLVLEVLEEVLEDLALEVLELVAEELIVDSTEGTEDTSDMMEDSTELISDTTEATEDISEEASDEDLGLLQPANPIAARTMTAEIARNFFMVLFLSVCKMNSLSLFKASPQRCRLKKATADSVHLLEKNAIVFNKNSQNNHNRIIESQSLFYDILSYCSKCGSSYTVCICGM